MNLLSIDLNHPAHYLTAGPISVSYGNLVMIGLVIVLFVVALVLPFPSHDDDEGSKK